MTDQVHETPQALIAHLKDVLHRDQTGLANALVQVWRTVGGWAWVAEGRGPYAWDDERYRAEMAAMIHRKTLLEASGLEP